MNSKDRRKHNRKFPYTFEVKRKFDPSKLYVQISEIDQWCDNQFGKGNWDKSNRNWYKRTYKFKLEKDKIWFILRWS